MDTVNADILILGGGCSGWSLLASLLDAGLDTTYKICLVEPEGERLPKTWSYWDHLEPNRLWKADYAWSELSIKTKGTTYKIEKDEVYKSIHSSSFYGQIEKTASTKRAVHILKDRIIAIDQDTKIAQGEKSFYASKFIIQNFETSISSSSYKSLQYPMIQHFGGLLVNSTKWSISKDEACFMDFNVSQEYGFAFMYLLPYSDTTCLVEYTLFSPKLLNKDIYISQVKKYLLKQFDLQENEFKIEDIELGQIPMDDRLPKIRLAEDIYLFGTAAGMTKASTGYTFSRIQKAASALAKSITKNGLNFDHTQAISNGISKTRYRLYDLILLDVLRHNPIQALKAFEKLFNKLGVEKMLVFLSENQSIISDLRVLNAAPKKDFIPALFRARKALLKHLIHSV